MRFFRLLLIVLLLIPTAAVAAAGVRPGETPAPKVGKPAPDFTLPDMQGKPFSLAAQKGKVVFLNFWATWCPPCREELPAMQRLNEVFAKKNFIILAVNADDTRSAVQKFLSQQPLSFPVLPDPEAKVQNLYGVYRFPETFLIDREGKIVQHYIGGRNWSSVEFLKYVTSLLGE